MRIICPLQFDWYEVTDPDTGFSLRMYPRKGEGRTPHHFFDRFAREAGEHNEDAFPGDQRGDEGTTQG